MGALPTAGKWVRLEVDASKVGVQPGMKVTGVAFTQFGGRAYWDKIGMVSVKDPAEDPEILCEKLSQLLGELLQLGIRIPPRLTHGRLAPDSQRTRSYERT